MNRDVKELAKAIAARKAAAIAALGNTKQDAWKRAELLRDKRDEKKGQIKQVEQERKLTQGNYNDLFPTPIELAERLISLVGVREEDRVLEPSAGTGRLAIAAKKAGGIVTCIEFSYNPAEYLRGIGFDTICNDFLEVNPIDFIPFDCVVMNPPFSNLADVEHLLHAWEFLRDGGILGAIISTSSAYNSRKKAEDFRDWLENQNVLHDEILPAGAFRASGTEVSSRLLIIRK